MPDSIALLGAELRIAVDEKVPSVLGVQIPIVGCEGGPYNRVADYIDARLERLSLSSASRDVNDWISSPPQS